MPSALFCHNRIRTVMSIQKGHQAQISQRQRGESSEVVLLAIYTTVVEMISRDISHTLSCSGKYCSEHGTESSERDKGSNRG